MPALRRAFAALTALIRKEHLERELDDELRAYLDASIEHNVRAGMTLADATRAARVEIGGVEAVKDRIRDVGWESVVESLWRDVRYSTRVLRRSPGFTSIAVASLALGLGANTAIFSVLDAVLLKALPVSHPEELFVLRSGEFSYPAYDSLRENGAFADLLATSGITALDVGIDQGELEKADVSLVSGSYFSVLGVPAQIGRTFTADDDRVPGSHPIVVLSDGYWERRFGRDPASVGKTIRVSGTPLTIVGVAPPGFFGERVGVAPAFWIPLTMWARVVPGRNLIASPTTSWLQVIGRLRPGSSTVVVEEQLTAQYRQVLNQTFPHAEDDLRREIAQTHVTLSPADRGLSTLRGQFSLALEILMGVVGLVLLIACANVANLLLARAMARRREIALRLALGISRRRLIRQLLIESVLLSLAGAIAGLFVGWWSRELLLRLVSGDGSRVPLATATDARLLAFVGALSIATGITFGLVPAWLSARVDLSAILGGARRGAIGGARSAIGSVLVVIQVAISIVLLVGAGLFLRTLANLHNVDLGFAPERLLIVDVDPMAAGYRGPAFGELCQRLLERLNAVPGVTSATFSENGVLRGRDSDTNRMRPDDFVPGPEGIPSTRFDAVGPQYFNTLGIPLLAGRDIGVQDVAASGRVMVVNEAMAHLFFGHQNPVGRRMLWGTAADSTAYEIVGVTRVVKHHGPRDQPDRRFYVPYFQRQSDLASARFMLRTAANPAAVLALTRQAILSEDALLPIVSVDTATALDDRTLVRERMVATLSALLTAIALTLACIGLYGLMAYRVVQRTSEMGIRMALGAARIDVLWLVLRQDVALIAAGMVIGAPAAIAVSGLIRSLLFGVAPADPASLITALSIMTALGIAAGAGPALRAAQIEPVVALRHD
jgi:predicted permease